MGSSSSDIERLLSILAQKKRVLFVYSSLGLLTLVVGIAVIGIQILYPYHTLVALLPWSLAGVFLLHRVLLGKRLLEQMSTVKAAERFLRRESVKIKFGLGCLAIVLVVITVRPFGNDPFAEYRGEALREFIAKDAVLAAAAMDYLESTGNVVIEQLSQERTDTLAAEVTQKQFNEFLKAVQYSESLTNVHRYFDQLPYRYGEQRKMSFLISYSLYVKKYELLHRIATRVDSEFERKILNEYMESVGRSGVYREMVERFYLPATRVRLSLGALYFHAFGTLPNDSFGGVYGVLKEKAGGSYGYLVVNFDDTLYRSVHTITEAIRSRAADSWLPVQRTVANAMGRTILSERGHEKLITVPQIVEMRQVMEPGDIMLQRRNWHLSNVGIPGFWTHAALYTGSLTEMDRYFSAEFPYEGYDSFSELLQAQHPRVYELFKTRSGEFERSVIEAIEPGVVAQSLEESAHADFVVVLRPNLDRAAKLVALLRAVEQVGKPYDYNFDFDTRDALVCSELIYDAYIHVEEEKEGIHFSTSMVSGRRIVSPLDIAKRFKAEYGQPDAALSFVYFIKGDEVSGTATPSDLRTFIDSVSWDKFSFSQRY